MPEPTKELKDGKVVDAEAKPVSKRSSHEVVQRSSETASGLPWGGVNPGTVIEGEEVSTSPPGVTVVPEKGKSVVVAAPSKTPETVTERKEREIREAKASGK